MGNGHKKELKTSHIFLEKQVKRSCNSFVKLDKYINSNQRLTKTQLKILMEELKKPLFATQEIVVPSEEFIDWGDL